MRLPEVLVVLLHSNVGRKVENATDPERRIEGPGEIIETLLEFALQYVVHRNPDVLEIGKIGNTGADDSRHHEHGTFRHGLITASSTHR
jgi:hypothetical protein